MSQQERALLPMVGLQGAIGTLGGFLGFFIVRSQGIEAMFLFTAAVLSMAMLATFLVYNYAHKLGIQIKTIFKLSFILPGILLLSGNQSQILLAMAYGTFGGMVWGSRHWLEMSLIKDEQRDTYSAHSNSVTVAVSILTTLIATLILSYTNDNSYILYCFYGVIALAGGLILGNGITATAPIVLKSPLKVMGQKQFINCLPLFFLESGLFGISEALNASGAVKSLGNASTFGWLALCAGAISGIALFYTRNHREIENRREEP